MATAAPWALQKGIYSTLSTAPQLTALLGDNRLYDDVPQRASYPYLTMGQSRSDDWSTGTEDGEEHVITLHVWSEGNGKKQALEIIGTLKGLLHDKTIALDGHHLINLRHEFSDARRDPDGRLYHGVVRYRAKTEPIV